MLDAAYTDLFVNNAQILIMPSNARTASMSRSTASPILRPMPGGIIPCCMRVRFSCARDGDGIIGAFAFLRLVEFALRFFPVLAVKAGNFVSPSGFIWISVR